VPGAFTDADSVFGDDWRIGVNREVVVGVTTAADGEEEVVATVVG